jgi:hypothetical protein
LLLFRTWAVPLLTLAGGLGLLTKGLYAQEPQKPEVQKPAPATEKSDYQIFRLKNVTAAELSRVLAELFARGSLGPGGRTPPLTSIRLTSDERTNSLIVSAPAADMALIERLIKALDIERSHDDRQVRVFQLKHLQPDDTLVQALQLLIPPGGRPSLAIDPVRKTVVITGDERTLETAAALLTRLDVPLDPRDPGRPPAAASQLQVRIVWLVSGLKREDAPKPPDDLKEVVAELAKLGIEAPRLAAQTIVNTIPNGGTFSVQGSAKLDTPCLLSITGQIASNEPPSMQIAIQANREGKGPAGFGSRGGGRPAAQICNLQTQITTPLGHAVVLGVTPTEAMTSVFVVQVLRKEPAKAAAKP